VPIRPADLFDIDAVISAHDAQQFPCTRGRKLHDGEVLMAWRRALRIATIGYNLSIEKPGVVVHDRCCCFPFDRLLIDDCRNGR
jgi:hypothetical protein